MVVLIRVIRCMEDTSRVRRPVIRHLMVVVDVNPRQLTRNFWPFGRSVDLAVLAPVVFSAAAVAAWYVYVDEVAFMKS